MNNGLLYKTQTRFLFHAHIKIKIPFYCDEENFDEFFGIIEEVDKRYNSYREDSFFDRINKNAGSFVEVDKETIHLLKETSRFASVFDGEYDITIMPLIRLWGFYKNSDKRIPQTAELEGTKQLVDYQKIEIDKQKVRIAKGQEIITASFLKSYAVDKVVERMREKGISDAIINAGGSTIRALNDDRHPYWMVNVADPDNESLSLMQLKLSNQCFSTSAQTKTFVEIDSRRYGHIISPLNGYPSENKQIGIVSNNCFEGDIISTGLFNQTLDGFTQKMTELNKLFAVSGFLINKDGEKRVYSLQ